MASTNGDFLRAAAALRGVPERTLANVTKALAIAKTTNADQSLARLMLKHGRMSADARAHLEREYGAPA